LVQDASRGTDDVVIAGVGEVVEDLVGPALLALSSFDVEE
jgi:hypothetical protein